MVATVLLAALLCAPNVRLAPDQPLPYVFSDEPVIVEFLGEQDLDFDVMIVYGTEHFPSNSHGLGPISLHAGQPYWTTTHLEPIRFGTYNITINVQWPTGSDQHEFRLQRIRRPDLSNPPPVMVRIPARTGPWETLRRVLPASRVSIESTHPDLPQLLEVFTREQVNVRLILRGEESTIPEGFPPMSIAIPATSSAEDWARTARRIRTRIPSARTVLESPTPELLVALLQSGAAQLINSVSVDSHQALLDCRAAAERQGYENVPFSVYLGTSTGLPAAAHAWNAGAYVAEFSLDSLWSEGELTEEFGMMNALFDLIDQTRVAGRYSDESVDTILLREIVPDRTGHWIAPLTQSAGMAPADSYNDGDGNSYERPPDDLAYARGSNPDIVLAAIAYEVREEAIGLSQMTRVIGVLPEEVARAINRLAVCDGTVSMRAEFFALLRSLPTLEEAWHSGNLRKSDAVPAIACTERIVRRLSALEQVLGIPFVESIGETLDQCAEQQSIYLTSTISPGASAQRGEQLMMHISQLVDEARALQRQNRLIEASAIAALAEWRARSLVFAVKARPLTEIEPEPRQD